jgi:hypothetical protein
MAQEHSMAVMLILSLLSSASIEQSDRVAYSNPVCYN